MSDLPTVRGSPVPLGTHMPCWLFQRRSQSAEAHILHIMEKLHKGMLMTSKCYITATIKQRDPRGIGSRRVSLCTGQHISPIAIYFPKKSAGPPGLGIETSFISRNGFQWRAKSNSHLQGRGRKRGSECRRYLGTLTSG